MNTSSMNGLLSALPLSSLYKHQPAAPTLTAPPAPPTPPVLYDVQNRAEDKVTLSRYADRVSWGTTAYNPNGVYAYGGSGTSRTSITQSRDAITMDHRTASASYARIQDGFTSKASVSAVATKSAAVITYQLKSIQQDASLDFKLLSTTALSAPDDISFGFSAAGKELMLGTMITDGGYISASIAHDYSPAAIDMISQPLTMQFTPIPISDAPLAASSSVASGDGATQRISLMLDENGNVLGKDKAENAMYFLDIDIAITMDSAYASAFADTSGSNAALMARATVDDSGVYAEAAAIMVSHSPENPPQTISLETGISDTQENAPEDISFSPIVDNSALLDALRYTLHANTAKVQSDMLKTLVA